MKNNMDVGRERLSLGAKAIVDTRFQRSRVITGQRKRSWFDSKASFNKEGE